MLQCKIFSGSDSARVEREVNDFLSDRSRMLVHSVHQSCDYNRIFITVFFNLKTRSAKMKEAAIEQVTVPLPGEMTEN